jgi:protein involved in polysaccharide export with SLBB domain
MVRNRYLRVAALTVAMWAALFAPAFAALHAGDVLDIVIFDHPELSGPATISNDGFVSVPLIGRVRAAGAREDVLAERIRSKLEPFLYKPAVDVRLHTASSTVTFAGEATGSAVLKPGETLANMLARAKLAPSADIANVTIERDGLPLASSHPETVLAGGDVIRVGRKPLAVVVSGALKPRGPGGADKPSVTVYLSKLQPLGEALAAVTPAADADLSRITLRRIGERDAVVAAGATQLMKPARPGDELIVAHVANVTLLGAVSKQGQVVLRGDHSLASALALAGGPANDSDASRITIVHLDEKKQPAEMARAADPAKNPTLEDGDVVYVPKVRERFDPLKLVAALRAARARKIPK